MFPLQKILTRNFTDEWYPDYAYDFSGISISAGDTITGKWLSIFCTWKQVQARLVEKSNEDCVVKSSKILHNVTNT